MIANIFAANDRSRAAEHPTTNLHVEGVASQFGDDHFTGALLRPARGEAGGLVLRCPLLDAVGALLAPERGFLAALSEVFEADLSPHLEHLLIIQRLRLSVSFLSDTGHRRTVLNAWCSNVLSSPGFLVMHPPATVWQTEDPRVRFQLGADRRKDMELCVLFGPLGFAQLCDDDLEHPVPLLVLPWTPADGLLAPQRFPVKSFSQRLCVERIGRRRLLLFDKGSLY